MKRFLPEQLTVAGGRKLQSGAKLNVVEGQNVPEVNLVTR